MSRTTLAIILAAGEGTRMRSDLPKVLHPIGSRPMILHAVAACRAAKFDQIACVVGSKADLVRKAVGDFDADVTFYEQSERKGTAHAVRCAEPEIERGFDNVVVLNGDGPLLESSTLVSLVGELAGGADLAVLGFEAGDPDGYGRMIMNGEALVRVVEDKDANAGERAVTFVNSGMVAIRGDRASSWLSQITNDNRQKEYYLPDIVRVANAAGANVVAPRA